MGIKESSSDGTAGTEPDTTVLFVDDEPELLEIYEHMYGTRYDIRTASSAADALEQFGPHIDFAFFDRRMPEISGEEVVQTLRDEGYGTPMGFISAVDPSTDPDVEHETYLVKPIDREAIHRTIDRYAD